MAATSPTPDRKVHTMRDFGRLLASAALGLLATSATPAAAQPLDLSDTTPRDVLVQIDEYVDDYGAVGVAFGAPVTGQLTSDGVISTITLDGATVEALVDTLFAGVATAVPGSFSAYGIEIDVATGTVLSASVSGLVTVPILGAIAIEQTASSNTLAGYTLTNIFGFMLPVFCTGGAGCVIAPGSAYDGMTGQLNAVGVITSVFNIFTPFGDLRISEVPSPLACEVAMSQPSYVDGEDVVITSLRFQNTSASPVPARLRLQIGLPFGIVVDAIDLGAGGGFSVPALFDRQLGPVTMFTLQPGQPRGNFFWRCALEDPISGAVIAEDVANFVFQ